MTDNYVTCSQLSAECQHAIQTLANFSFILPYVQCNVHTKWQFLCN